MHDVFKLETLLAMNRLKVGINGFGRIGRNIFKAAFSSDVIEVVAINDLTNTNTLAHLLRYDSIIGRAKEDIRVDNDQIHVDNKKIKVTNIASIDELHWSTLGVDIVVESTGIFTDASIARKHIDVGKAKKVIISAPAKNDDITIVMGVNEEQYIPDKHDVISNASCTTNCLAPIVKVLLDNFGFHRGFMTTVHSYTNDQSILDSPHKDLRRARAAAVSMIPTTTGAAKAVALVLPEVKDKLDGMAIRVPTPNVSVIDLVAEINQEVDVTMLNNTFKEASKKSFKGIMECSEEHLVSVDFTGNSASSVVDLPLTAVIDKKLIKIVSWYDNEWGYSNRIVDLTEYVASRL